MECRSVDDGDYHNVIELLSHRRSPICSNVDIIIQVIWTELGNLLICDRGKGVFISLDNLLPPIKI